MPVFRNNVQTVSIPAGATGNFQLQILGKHTDNIPVDATADEILKLLQPILDPNNSDPTKSHTKNVAVARYGNHIVITFQGEHGTAGIEAIVGTAQLVTRQDGIHYFNIDTLKIDLGTGADDFNVQATDADTVTYLNTGSGEDRIYVTSDADANLTNQPDAHGVLDGIDGELNIDAGSDENALYVSDYSSNVADTNLHISNNSITGFNGPAPAVIKYAATDGNFNKDLVIWAGTQSDTITVDSVYTGGTSVTTVYANSGDDTLIVEAADDLAAPAHDDLVTAFADPLARRLELFGREGRDLVDASRATWPYWCSAAPTLT